MCCTRTEFDEKSFLCHNLEKRHQISIFRFVVADRSFLLQIFFAKNLANYLVVVLRELFAWTMFSVFLAPRLYLYRFYSTNQFSKTRFLEFFVILYSSILSALPKNPCSTQYWWKTFGDFLLLSAAIRIFFFVLISNKGNTIANLALAISSFFRRFW